MQTGAPIPASQEPIPGGPAFENPRTNDSLLYTFRAASAVQLETERQAGGEDRRR
jgi:hypothetical protein